MARSSPPPSSGEPPPARPANYRTPPGSHPIRFPYRSSSTGPSPPALPTPARLRHPSNSPPTGRPLPPSLASLLRPLPRVRLSTRSCQPGRRRRYPPGMTTWTRPPEHSPSGRCPPSARRPAFLYRRTDAAQFAGMGEALTENLRLALAAELDDQMLNHANGFLGLGVPARRDQYGDRGYRLRRMARGGLQHDHPRRGERRRSVERPYAHGR